MNKCTCDKFRVDRFFGYTFEGVSLNWMFHEFAGWFIFDIDSVQFD
ncbi:MAG: hypothetical protein FWE03_04210 [Firmicutes bacterium]|nr:hypothetical protein [Bacillota bacterium]